MINTKRLFSVMLTTLFIVSAIAAQDSGGTASQQGSLNLMVFKGIYGSDGLRLRNQTLETIAQAFSQGNTSDEIYAALEYMSMEGLKNKALNNRSQVLNNYAEIRLKVAAQLGTMGTAKAATILIQLCDAETDLYALRGTIKALGDIGINENDNATKAIVWKVRGFNQLKPDNNIEAVIIAAVDALDKINNKNDGFKNQWVFDDTIEFLDNVSRNEKLSKRRPAGQVSVQEHAKQVKEEMMRKDAQRK
jgi:hypothetical protein